MVARLRLDISLQSRAAHPGKIHPTKPLAFGQKPSLNAKARARAAAMEAGIVKNATALERWLLSFVC
jgi:hypothetical protein